MQIDMQRFTAVFFEEAAEHLSTLENGLLQLSSEGADQELLNSIFRSAHSIKGGSGTFGFAEVAAYTHVMESLLDQLREGEMSPTGDLIDTLLEATDGLSHLVNAAREGSSPPEYIHDLRRRLETFTAAPQQSPTGTIPKVNRANQHTCYQVAIRPHAEIMARGMDPLLLVRDLSSLGALNSLELDASRLPELSKMQPEHCYLGWNLELESKFTEKDLRDVFMFVEDECDVTIRAVEQEETASITPVAAEMSDERAGTEHGKTARRTQAAAESIRVSVDKVEELINLVGELVIANSMVHQAVTGAATEQFPLLHEALAAMERSTRELQSQVMGVRMMTVANVFRRFPRVVHDLATTLGKQVRVEIVGEDTELDKQVIEAIGDPLTHLVRNSVDHGIELPEDRVKHQKPAEGKVRLCAFHEGGKVIIEIEDDGRGLNAQRIREKAEQSGLIAANAELTDEQIYQLIFLPGLSTAEKLTDVSGRGVGMDVVKRNIEALNGQISIHSQPGKGTRFRISLPLTMAILDGLSVSVSGETYVVPLLSVIESLQPRPQDIKTVAQNGEILLVRGETLPLIRLHRMFGIENAITDPASALVVILEHQNRKYGLLVDALLGQMQVVMKSIEQNYRKVEGVSGATILGDGTVAFILDVPGLLRVAQVA